VPRKAFYDPNFAVTERNRRSVEHNGALNVALSKLIAYVCCYKHEYMELSLCMVAR
jgi:hypothetical protein